MKLPAMSKFVLFTGAFLLTARDFARGDSGPSAAAIGYASRLDKETQIETAWIYAGAIVLAAIIIGICILIASRRKHQPG